MDVGPKERLGTRWLRRSVTLPILFLLALLVTVALPLWLPLSLLLDLLTRGRTALARTVMLFFVLLLCEVLGVLAALCIWLVTVAGLRRAAFLRHNHRLQTLWGTALYHAGARLFSVRTLIEGARPAAKSGPLLCFVRHVSVADTVLPVLLLGHGARFRLRYVLKRELLLDPCLDIVGQRLPNCFVRRGSARAEEEARRVVALYHQAGGLGPGDALVIFPEGTRFSPDKRAASLARIEKGGAKLAQALAPALLHTLSPLRAGALSLLAENRGADLIVLGHVGLEGAATIGAMVRGRLRGATVRVRLWRVPFAEIPTDGPGQAELLARLWREVDDFVGVFTPQRRSGT